MTYENAFAALGDPTRKAIFEHLAHQSSSVGALADKLPVSRPAVSQHLKILVNAGLITVHTQGTRRIYSVVPDKLTEMRFWLDDMWNQALASFADAANREARK